MSKDNIELVTTAMFLAVCFSATPVPTYVFFILAAPVVFFYIQGLFSSDVVASKPKPGPQLNKTAKILK